MGGRNVRESPHQRTFAPSAFPSSLKPCSLFRQSRLIGFSKRTREATQFPESPTRDKIGKEKAAIMNFRVRLVWLLFVTILALGISFLIMWAFQFKIVLEFCICTASYTALGFIEWMANQHIPFFVHSFGLYLSIFIINVGYLADSVAKSNVNLIIVNTVVMSWSICLCIGDFRYIKQNAEEDCLCVVNRWMELTHTNSVWKRIFVGCIQGSRAFVKILPWVVMENLTDQV